MRTRKIYLMHYQARLHIVLHQPEIPYNTGSVGRTCVAIGAKLWLIRPLGFQIDDYHLRRAGMDYWQYLEWEAVDDWASLIDRLSTDELPHSRFWYFSKTAQRSYTDANFQLGDVFVFGCESQGLPATLLEAHPDQSLRIPIREAARSLNLSNSVAIAAYEAVRQWNYRANK